VSRRPKAQPPAVVDTDAELLPGWTSKADPYRSAMLSTFGWPLRLFARLFFSRIQPGPQVEAVRKAADQGSVVYVMRTRSGLDYLFFNHLAMQEGLPLARFANGVDTAPLAPIRTTVAGWFARRRWRRRNGGMFPDPVDDGYLRRLVAAGGSALVFLRRGRELFDRDGHSRDLVEELVLAQMERDEPIFLVPQILVWERAPDRTNRGLLDVLLGEPDRPGAFRKVLFFLLNHRNAVVRVGEPVDLRQFVRDHDGQPVARIAKKLRWLLLGYLYRERKVVKGPDVRPRRWIFDRILAEPAVQAEIVRTASRTGKSEASVERRARRILDKSGADFRWGMIQAFRWALDIVCSRIYSGVEFPPEDAERLREAARRGTVLLIPSHRSHFDYLLLSWVIFHEGMVPPFIRRSFAGDDLYATLIEHYMRALISEGYTQEFFIEGTRSRTGKMLSPKIGLLSTYVDAMADRIVPDIQIVPVYVAYERIVEDYTKELSGGEKAKENAGGLISQAGVLRKRFGRVYVKTNEPISLREMLEQHKDWKQLDRDGKKGPLKTLGNRITAEIQDATVVTPSTVSALVLLTHDARGITRERFLQRARFFRRWMEDRQAHFSDAWHFPEDALNESVALFSDNGFVEILPDEDSPVDSVEECDHDILAIAQDARERMQLDYYKNNVLFHFVPAAFFLTGMTLLGRERERLGRVRRRFEFLRELFAEEFFFHPNVTSEELLREAGRRLERLGVIAVTSPEGDDVATLVRGPDPWLEEADFERAELQLEVGADDDLRLSVTDPDIAGLLMSTLRNFFEAYYVVLVGSVVLRKGALTEKELVASLMKVGRKMFLTEDVTRPEAISKVNLTNAVRHFRRKGVFRIYDGVGKDARLSVDDAVRGQYLAPMRRLFHSGRTRSA
jgi:glycerol-3-phosphate O-acyltransferase